MSVSRASSEEGRRKAALARIKKKVTGGVFGMPKCSVCGREFTERELLAEDLVWAVGKAGSVQFHPACYRREFSRKEAKAKGTDKIEISIDYIMNVSKTYDELLDKYRWYKNPKIGKWIERSEDEAD